MKKKKKKEEEKNFFVFVFKMNCDELRWGQQEGRALVALGNGIKMMTSGLYCCRLGGTHFLPLMSICDNMRPNFDAGNGALWISFYLVQICTNYYKAKLKKFEGATK